MSEMRIPKYVVVDFGHTLFFLDYGLKEQLFEYHAQKKDAVLLEDITGKEISLNFSQVASVYTSTPEQRELSYFLNAEGNAEKKAMLKAEGLWEDYDDD